MGQPVCYNMVQLQVWLCVGGSSLVNLNCHSSIDFGIYNSFIYTMVILFPNHRRKQ